jgi:cephalosporin hydroxylase
MSKYDDLWNHAIQWGIQQEPEELKGFMEFLDTEIHPRNFIEIGVLEGATFYCWCQLTPKEGIKIGIDKPDYSWNGSHNLTIHDIDNRKKRVQAMSNNVHYLIGDSTDPKIKSDVQNILNDNMIDFLFIDGDHTYEGVLADYNNYAKYVRPGGCIAFHDICNSPGQEGVHKFWKEVKGNKIHIISNGKWAGIGVILL